MLEDLVRKVEQLHDPDVNQVDIGRDRVGNWRVRIEMNFTEAVAVGRNPSLEKALAEALAAWEAEHAKMWAGIEAGKDQCLSPRQRISPEERQRLLEEPTVGDVCLEYDQNACTFCGETRTNGDRWACGFQGYVMRGGKGLKITSLCSRPTKKIRLR